MRIRISIIVFCILILLLGSYNISFAKNIKLNHKDNYEKNLNSEIDDVSVGNVTILIYSNNGNDYIEWLSWFKLREFTLHFGFEELRVVLPYHYNASDLYSMDDYDLYVKLEVNGLNCENITQINNGNIDFFPW